MTTHFEDSPITRNRYERGLAWVLFLAAMGLAALLSVYSPAAPEATPPNPAGIPHDG